MKWRIGLYWLALIAWASGQGLGLPEPSRVVDWSWELQQSEPFTQPFLAEFTRGPYRLGFLATHHGNQQATPTFQLIERSLQKGPWEALAIEGIPLGKESEVLQYFARNPAKDGFWPAGETSYAVALSGGLPVIGVEPAEPDILKAVLAQGETLEDLVGFYVVRQVPQWRRQRSLNSITQKELFERFVAAVCRDFAVPVAFNWSQFHTWYRQRNGRTFDWISLENNESAPLTGGAYYTQRMAARVSRIRDEFMVTTLSRKLDRYHSILVVCGSAHLASQRPAWEALLGAPVRQEP